jgi:coenzyme F420-reducing hydrogenase delta subunit
MWVDTRIVSIPGFGRIAANWEIEVSPKRVDGIFFLPQRCGGCGVSQGRNKFEMMNLK